VKVLLVGGGGREHALAWKLAQSPRLRSLVAAPGNPGIAAYAECISVKDTAVEEIAALADRQRSDLVVVGPEVPLALGLGDRLRARGIPVFGPSAAAARIESSKAFAKDLMARYGIPTARFEIFTDAAPAREYCRQLGAPVVIKVDGLAAGKGAMVCESLAEADRALALCLEQGQFGEAGRRVVVEEFMEGEELSFFVLAGRDNALPLGAAQDHKTVFDDDRGPNTGGMGAYSPAPLCDPAIEARVMREIVAPTLCAMADEGCPYQGVLYVGLMIGAMGARVVEFNCRFGDPECQVLLPRLDADLLPVLQAVATGQELPRSLDWTPKASVCVVIASAGYPGAYQTGAPIRGVEEANRLPGVTVFQAGTAHRDGVLVTAGGRVLGVQALGRDIATALADAYAAVASISFEGMHYRRDIARRAVGRR
jgi:phosphoribosylamine--glycine ligase